LCLKEKKRPIQGEKKKRKIVDNTVETNKKGGEKHNEVCYGGRW